MKRSLIAAALVAATLLAAAPAGAQAVPSQMTFTGQLRADDGSPTTGPHRVEFRLYGAPTGGANVWGETHEALEARDGLVVAALGSQSPLDPAVFTGDPLYLEVVVDNVVLQPRVPLLSVPYAMRAATAGVCESLGGLAPEDVQTRVNGACAAGQAISAIGADGSVTCDPDDDTDTTYGAGAGLVLSGTTFATDPTVAQSRVFGSCWAGSSIRTVNEDGSVVCESDTDTTYYANTGLTLSGTGFSPNYTYVQARVSGSCAAGSAIRSIASDGTVTCDDAVQTIDSYSISATTTTSVYATTTGPRKFCALGRVSGNIVSGSAEYHRCDVDYNAGTGYWTLEARSNGSGTMSCEMHCF